MQKQIRLDREFNELEQGANSHADFRALWEAKLQDMEESGMDMPMEATLFRKYLTKLESLARQQIMQKDWKLDGSDQPSRPMRTWQDAAKAMSLRLEERADIYATGATGRNGDRIMNFQDNPQSGQGGGQGIGGQPGFLKGH